MEENQYNQEVEPKSPSDFDKVSAPQPKNNTNLLLWGIIALLVVALAYFFITKNKAIEEKDNTELRLEEVNIEKDAIAQEYDAAIVRLDNLTSENASLDSLVNTQGSQINGMRSQIESILKDKNATAAQLSKARGMIAGLEELVTKFQKQIGALKQENIQLIDNQRQLTEEKKIVEGEKANLEKNKVELEQTIDVAKVLNVSNINMKVIDKRKNLLGKEKEKETSKARKADLLEVNFDLGVNRVIESGEKPIYIVVKDPTGQVIHSSGSGNGKINLAEGGSQEYTTIKNVPYSQGKSSYGIKSTCVPTNEFKPGNYKVELYHKGYLIGQDNITLK